MAEGRRSDAWERTSWVIATLINVNSTKGQPVKPSEVNPMTAGPETDPPKVKISELRGLFVDGLGFKTRKAGAAAGGKQS